MKCNSCGAIGSSQKTICEFCGVDMKADTSSGANSVGNVINTVAAPQVTFAKDSLNLVSEINSTPSSGFNVWAFLFPIGYLWGYDADENTKKVAVTLLIPALIVSLLGYFSYSLMNFAHSLAFLWGIFVSYLVSTRTHVLVVKDGRTFKLGKGILAEIIYLILAVLIYEL